MTKTVCDICGKEMSTSKFVDAVEERNFCIASNGRIWDICDKCRVDFNRWITMHKAENEEEG